MSDIRPKIPDITLETLGRTLFKEAARYGFQRIDYVRFANLLLDLAMNGDNSAISDRATKYLCDGGRSHSDNANGFGLPLLGARVDVRPFDARGDLDLLEAWVRDPQGRHFVLSATISRPPQVREVTGNPANLIGVITLKDGRPIGAVAFLHYDSVQRKAELRKLIGEPALRGMGYAKEACKLWLSYGLSCMSLKKVYLNTLDTHLRNIRLNEELGFKIEGILRNEVYIDGQYHDVLRMGLWRE